MRMLITEYACMLTIAFMGTVVTTQPGPANLGHVQCTTQMPADSLLWRVSSRTQTRWLLFEPLVDDDVSDTGVQFHELEQHRWIGPSGEFIVTRAMASDTSVLNSRQPISPETHDSVESSRSALMKQRARRFVRGFVLPLLAMRAGVLPASMAFSDWPANQGRLSVQLQGMTGASNLKNRRNPGEADLTSLRGVGGRLVYGVTRNVSAEVALAWLSTDRAAFEDASTTEATTGRMQIGGVLQVGETIVPHVRAGIGARVSSYTSSRAEDSNLRSSLLAYGGLGVDAWVGDRFIAGLSAAFVGPVGGGDDQSSSVELGLHLGYAWKP